MSTWLSTSAFASGWKHILSPQQYAAHDLPSLQLHATLVARSAARRQEAEVLAASLSRELAGLLAQLPEQR